MTYEIYFFELEYPGVWLRMWRLSFDTKEDAIDFAERKKNKGEGYRLLQEPFTTGQAGTNC